MISPARLGAHPSEPNAGVPFAPDFDDVYHPVAGAWAQAQHVFLTGNALPERWQGRDRFVILETGFGLGNNFLATWAAWQADANRCQRLFFISIEKHPLTLDDLRRVHASSTDPVHQRLAERLCQAWPPLTSGIHLLDFDGITLLLVLGDAQEVMPNLTASVDAFFLDGFAPAKNPSMWDERWLSRLNRLAAPEATAATWSVARPVRDALLTAGFELRKEQGFIGKRDMLQATFRPRHVHVPLPGAHWPAPTPAHRHALIVGGGLAGCASAWALTQAGWHVTLIERHSDVAKEASGNAGGLFHSIVHTTENIHTRAHRAAALFTADVVRPWMAQGTVRGACEGLLRLEPRLSDADAQALLHAAPWLQAHVAWLSHAQAQQLSEVPVSTGGWLFKQGGWLNPADYARALLTAAEHTGQLTRLMAHSVARLATCPNTSQWQAFDEQGHCIASASSAVLCNANDMGHLLTVSHLTAPDQAMPLQKIRGQISQLDLKHPDLADLRVRMHPPMLPLAGHGYALQTPDGQLIFGATTQAADDDASIREADTQHNLMQAMQLGLLLEMDVAHMPSAAIQGRTAWRASTPDRLPLVGAWPSLPAESEPLKASAQVRRVPRLRHAQGGLYVFSGLGSRGITWAALGARLLSHWVTGEPCPVETDLRDAMDPARFQVRHARAQGSDQATNKSL